MPDTAVRAAAEGLPTATTFLAVTPSMRLRIATTIENLIALLDEIDGDPDLELEPDAEDGADAEWEHDTKGCPVAECCDITFPREVSPC
ncbi:hypothetical protein [Mesorhizobium sp. CN2-181]|uniref:hypothetical protein n=1 Tax=Mesorhizobium yinganensis TaxID=3157707 RepID=UPI0032B7BD8E